MCWERLLIVGSRELDINLDLLRGGGWGSISFIEVSTQGLFSTLEFLLTSSVSFIEDNYINVLMWDH